MIAKATRGASAYSIAGYLHGKGRHNEHKTWDGHAGGSVLMSDLAPTGATSASWARGMTRVVAYREKTTGRATKKPIYQVSLSLAPEDKDLDREQWREAVTKWAQVQGLDLDNHPHAVVQHDPRHVHVVICRAGYDGQLWHAQNDYKKNEKAMRQIEKDFNLRTLETRKERVKAGKTSHDRLPREARAMIARGEKLTKKQAITLECARDAYPRILKEHPDIFELDARAHLMGYIKSPAEALEFYRDPTDAPLSDLQRPTLVEVPSKPENVSQSRTEKITHTTTHTPTSENQPETKTPTPEKPATPRQEKNSPENFFTKFKEEFNKAAQDVPIPAGYATVTIALPDGTGRRTVFVDKELYDDWKHAKEALNEFNEARQKSAHISAENAPKIERLNARISTLENMEKNDFNAVTKAREDYDNASVFTRAAKKGLLDEANQRYKTRCEDGTLSKELNQLSDEKRTLEYQALAPFNKFSSIGSAPKPDRIERHFKRREAATKRLLLNHAEKAPKATKENARKIEEQNRIQKLRFPVTQEREQERGLSR